MENSVGIIGCGWLGKALAKTLIDDSYVVTVTTQSADKKALLEQQGITTELLSLPTTHIEKKLLVFQQRCLVIAITPQFRQGKVDYPEKVAQLVHLAELGNIKQIILVSSTAIYQGLVGEVDESAELDLSIDKVALLNDAEQAAMAFKGKVVILRLAGLVGDDRHPSKFLQGNRQIIEPHVPVNLIHQRDVIGLMQQIINDDNFVGTYNGVSNTNATKEYYYKAAARALDLPVPNFVDQPSEVVGKKIRANKIREKLSYQFYYDDLVMWLLN